ncbi:MAG TPA: ABC transporter ATP-binding protein, partial [Candidatus Limnocylindrales bacterium]|nr:ABC transporter ATP-binding protein [Candidatus Limnocylindrales bacterium]
SAGSRRRASRPGGDGVIGLLRAYLRPYTLPLLVTLVLLLVQSIANLYLPTLNGDIINNGIAKGDNDYIVRTGGFMLLVTFLNGVAAAASVYLGARIAMGFGRDVRSGIFRQVESFSQVEVNHFGTASLITRNTNDVQQVQILVFMALTVMVSAPILAVGGIIMALRQDVPLSGLLVVILPLMAVVIAIVMSRAIPLFRAMQVKLDRINQVMRETLAGVRVIRAFVRTRHEEARFDEANRDLFSTALSVNRLFAITIPTMTAILNLSTVAVMWFGAERVEAGHMPIGNLTAFLQYLMQILFAVLMAVFMFVFVPRAAVSAGRIQEVLTTEPSIRDPDHPVELPLVPPLAAPTGDGVGGDGVGGDGVGGNGVGGDGVGRRVAGTVELHGVTFGYPGAEEPVLHDVSLVARPGQTTAIVGSTGSGKSTLLNLIPRFYDASQGAVMVDGVDVREMRRADLWARLGVVPQRAFLFSGTVGSNLRYGDESATDEELWHALEIAQAADFVREMPEGLEAPIAQGGQNVSGGQRQRLAIARAIVKKADIYLFDDSFSALDFATDARLRAALRRELAHATVVIVAQRVGTIMNADRIVVLDGGRVVGIGRHKELLESNETYREIVFSQLTEAEAVA